MSASPASTWLGGTVCVPRALRVSESTMKTRVKPVIRIRIAGAMASTVITMMMRTADDGAFRPLTLTLTLDEAASNERVMGPQKLKEASGPSPVLQLSDELSSPAGVRERHPMPWGRPPRSLLPALAATCPHRPPTDRRSPRAAAARGLLASVGSGSGSRVKEHTDLLGGLPDDHDPPRRPDHGDGAVAAEGPPIHHLDPARRRPARHPPPAAPVLAAAAELREQPQQPEHQPQRQDHPSEFENQHRPP